jgi:hypothetical protein
MAALVDLHGRQIGKWLVVSKAEAKPAANGKQKHSMWLCRCECGTVRAVRASFLNQGTSASCGCARRQRMSELGKGRRLSRGQAVRNLVLADYKKRAAARDLDWGITDEVFDALVQADCRYCGRAPATVCSPQGYWGAYVRNGIDRSDNTQGYVPGNVVPCCEACNKAKLAMSALEFIAHVRRIADHMAQYPL